MMQATPTPSHAGAPKDTGQEVPFEMGELVYSRTDERGVILAANDVFERLGGFAYSEMIGAPHKIVRHPDMPKAFFHIFWQYLKAGEPAVGYVKNRSKDGRHYWVLAAAIPYDGGYFSVRMRPSSAIFHTIRAEYARLRRREETEKLSAEASAEILLSRLKELGYHSYPEFMSQALHQESLARDAALGKPPDKVATHLSGLVTALNDALKEQTRLVSLFDSLKLLPVNMRLIAARLEPQGGPISQISMNYKTSFDNISEKLSKFVTGEGNICGQMDIAVRRSLILSNCARLHLEMARHIRKPDRTPPEVERSEEYQIVETLGQSSHARVQISLNEALRLAAALIASAFEIRRLVLGLDTIRILGRVESRRDHVSEVACSATLDQIDAVQAEISESLQSLSNLAVAIQTGLSLINVSRRPEGETTAQPGPPTAGAPRAARAASPPPQAAPPTRRVAAE